MAPNAESTARILLRKLHGVPAIAVVLGSGFDEIANHVRRENTVAYRDLPGFPRSTVKGHRGLVIKATLNHARLLLLCGRSHFYEGHTMDAVTFPIRVLAAAGVTTLVLTNAAGGIHSKLRSGDFMAIRDHINFMGVNPLRGSTKRREDRFVDLTQTYDIELLAALVDSARAARIRCRKGIYLAVSGPSYETPAEIRAFRRLGADAVGMSTVPEAIVARECGLRVAALSFITNQAAGIGGRTISHDDVLGEASVHSHAMVRLIAAFVGRLAPASKAGIGPSEERPHARAGSHLIDVPVKV